MATLKTITSKEPPKQKNCIWAKPVEGGYALYILAKGKWQPIVPAVPDATVGTDDDEYGFATKEQGERADTAVQVIKINGIEVERNTSETVPPEVNIELGSAAFKDVNTFQPAIQVGTWEEKPEQPYIGQLYYCKDIVPPIAVVEDNPINFEDYPKGCLIVCTDYTEDEFNEPEWSDMYGFYIAYEDRAIETWQALAAEAQGNNG